MISSRAPAGCAFLHVFRPFPRPGEFRAVCGRVDRPARDTCERPIESALRGDSSYPNRATRDARPPEPPGPAPPFGFADQHSGRWSAWQCSRGRQKPGTGHPPRWLLHRSADCHRCECHSEVLRSVRTAVLPYGFSSCVLIDDDRGVFNHIRHDRQEYRGQCCDSPLDLAPFFPSRIPERSGFSAHGLRNVPLRSISCVDPGRKAGGWGRRFCPSTDGGTERRRQIHGRESACPGGRPSDGVRRRGYVGSWRGTRHPPISRGPDRSVGVVGGLRGLSL